MRVPDVVTRVRLLEDHGADLPVGNTDTLEVCSHWNRKQLVVLKLPGVNVTVDRGALTKAIQNAGNVR